MSILNPIVSKFSLTAGVPQEVYFCPGGKSHSILDVTFYKDNSGGDALIAIALATEANPANLTSVDYFIDDIQLIGIVNSAELNKVVVGSGERLFIQVLSGPDVVARITGVEETNPKVLKAGRLAAMSIPGTSQTQVYSNALGNTSYISASITIFNNSMTLPAQIQGWIGSNAVPTATDKILNVSIPANDTTVIENLLLAPNEKIFIQSDQVNSEVFINGTVVASA